MRELVNAIETAFTLGGSSLIVLRDLPRAPTGGYSAELRSAGGEFLKSPVSWTESALLFNASSNPLRNKVQEAKLQRI
jgi:hypothetical protein